MAIIKLKDLKAMPKNEREKKLNELKLELIKASSSKSKIKVKEVKKIIARIHTLNK